MSTKEQFIWVNLYSLDLTWDMGFSAVIGLPAVIWWFSIPAEIRSGSIFFENLRSRRPSWWYTGRRHHLLAKLISLILKIFTAPRYFSVFFRCQAISLWYTLFWFPLIFSFADLCPNLIVSKFPKRFVSIARPTHELWRNLSSKNGVTGKHF